MDVTMSDFVPLLTYFGISLGAYVLRLVYRRQRVPLVEGFLDALAASGSGVFVGSFITIYPMPTPAKIAIAALAGFIGPDLLAGLLAISKAFKDSPDQFLLKYIYAIRGVKTGMDVPTPPENVNPPKETTQDHSK
jgi:hypothetical protein